MSTPEIEKRRPPLEMTPEEFRALGHRLVDRVSELLHGWQDRPVTPGNPPSVVRAVLGDAGLPEEGMRAEDLVDETAELLIRHSLFNGHPRFWGYITSPASPIGALADLLAAAVNPNVGAWTLSPIATEIELQTVRWVAEMIGYPTTCGGLLVSGGNMANFVCFLAARHAKAGWDLRTQGLRGPEHPRLRTYASGEAHVWLQKAADMAGLGTDSIRWIETDSQQRLDPGALVRQIESDVRAGDRPFLVVASTGTVSTGAIDPLREMAEVCRRHDLWLHADGAYGAFAATLPEAPPDLRCLDQADSVAVDPHKWLYAPLEAGCVLVRDAKALHQTFLYRPPYYKFEEVGGEPTTILNQYGPQNSRGFRALKVWMGLRQVGRQGYVRMIREDIELARRLHQIVDSHPELQALTQGLSITTFRYVPRGRPNETEEYLNRLNEELLARLQQGGEVFVSNAVIDGKYVLRACIVNFRTQLADIQALPEVVVRIGREVDHDLRKT